MTHLLDVNALLALLWEKHEHNERMWRWMDGAEAVALCPLTELGFIRISTQPVFGASVEQARKMLADYKAAKKPRFIPCNVETLKTAAPKNGRQTTDFYLASLAAAHGMKLATLENDLGHPAAFTIPGPNKLEG
jgi:toxin-antitoxin system PIN domain toxin